MKSSDVVVAQLWRYPVKSMQGERLPAVRSRPTAWTAIGVGGSATS